MPLTDTDSLQAEEEGFEPPVHLCTKVFKTEQEHTQPINNKGLNNSSEHLLQENLQGCSECLQNALPSELFELISVWDELPEHVRQTIKMLVDTAAGKNAD